MDVVIYACTSGTAWRLVANLRTQLIHQSRPNAAVTNPVTAALAAFGSF
ncbi:hypothetical protein O9993_17545 [Vibrio lentus]|nr:hypothetical protein [Vibrio lentus]